MAISFIQTLDNGVKSLIFSRFSPLLGITDSNKDNVFAPKTLAQRKIAEKRGAGTVEFLSLWRGNISYDWSRQNSPIARQGLSVEFGNSSAGGSGTTHIITIKAVPAVINYDFWVWSKDLDKMTQAVESYLKWQHDTPQLILYYSGLYEMDMYLKFGTVVDETDYNIYEKGSYYVYRFPLTLEGWMLTTIDTKSILKIILDVYLREGSAPNYYDTLLNEYVINATPTP